MINKAGLDILAEGAKIIKRIKEDGEKMKIPFTTIPVRESVGTVLCHDITQILPGERPEAFTAQQGDCRKKGPVFRKGHIVREEDIPVLLSIGKENLYVFKPVEGFVHENEAAERLMRAVAGQNLRFTDVKEGRIDALAAVKGLLQVDVERLLEINSVGDITLATLHTMHMVQEGQAVAGGRVVPLVVEEEKLQIAERICQHNLAPLIQVLPLKKARVGLVTTGNEVFEGRIKDAFGPVLREKFAVWGSDIIGQVFTPDTGEQTSQAILDFVAEGADIVCVTGGMSVDPDDKSPAAIKATGASIESYGAPAFPGAMFLLAYLGQSVVVGLPGCVMYNKTTVFDLIMPRLLAGVFVSARDINALGHGGFCAGCSVCRYPFCPFGKG